MTHPVSLAFCAIVLLSRLGCYASKVKSEDCSCSLPSIDYYWRPYEGFIPNDAVKGGRSAGNDTFIGQIPARTSAGVIPAIIYPGQKAAEGTYSGRFRHEEYVKILCSPEIEKIEWLQTSIEDLHLLNDYYLIVGGYEIVNGIMWPLYIGRVNHDNKIIVGKVFTVDSEYKGLRIPISDGNDSVYSTFEILVYSR